MQNLTSILALVVMNLLVCRVSLADAIQSKVLGGKLNVTLPAGMEDVSLRNHRSYSTRFSKDRDGLSEFAVTFSETYGSAPRNIDLAILTQLKSMGLRPSKDGAVRFIDSDLKKYCAVPESGSNTILLCLVVPEGDTVKVASFEAGNSKWRPQAIDIVRSIRSATRVQWGGRGTLGASTVELHLDDMWTLELRDIDKLSYRLLRRVEFGAVGPTCDVALDSCVDASSYEVIEGSKHAARMVCNGTHCAAQVDRVWKGYCVIVECEAVTSQAYRGELQNMFKSVQPARPESGE